VSQNREIATKFADQGSYARTKQSFDRARALVKQWSYISRACTLTSGN
jgi:hypothetical protein